MQQANRIDPRAKALKDYFATINEFPGLAKESPLIQKTTLERLAIKLHLTPDQLAASLDEQARHLGKALTLKLFLAEYKKETRNVPFLQGLLLFWHSYPAPISVVHPAPSVISVVAYCSDASNLGEFLKDARRWASAAYANDSQLLRELLALVIPENLRKMVVAGLPKRPTESERRTYGNYLNAAAREVARELESLVPEFFGESEVAVIGKPVEERKEEPTAIVPIVYERQIQVQPPRQLELVARRVSQICAWLPGPGATTVPTDYYFERPLLFREVRGQPHAPSLVTSTDADVKGMSGFLSGLLGSGRTAFLKSLAHIFARSFLDNPERALAFYFSAADFVLYARNRRSIYELITESLAISGDISEGIAELPDLLRRLDQAGKLLLLVDDLDRLPSADQSEVLAQLTFSPAVVFAALPWQVESLSKLTVRAHLGEFWFPALDADSQMALLDRVARPADAVFNRQTVKQLCFELPELAQEPLGLVTILEQAQHPWTDMTQAVEVALEEYARRVGFPIPPFHSNSPEPKQEWRHLENAAFTLNHTLRELGGYERLNKQPNLVVTRAMVENPNGYSWQMTWEQVLQTGLFRPVQSDDGEQLALVNLDFVLYLLAQQARNSHWSFDLPAHPIHRNAAELLRRAGRHLENLNNPNPDLPPKTYIPPPVVPESKPWFARFPEIFRVLS